MKDNKLIAEFMGKGGTFNHDKTMICTGIYPDTMTLMKYHTSWDWLMPVVKKCRVQSNSEDSHWEAIYYSLEGCDIDVTYKAVVEFIKEHQSLDQQVYLSKYTCDSCGDRTESVCFDEDKDINECMDCM